MNDADRKSRPSETGAVNNPLPSLARADRRQREQNAADVTPTPSAASPFSQVGVFALKAIAHIKAPEGLVKS